jgi:hypothetical protein
MVDRVSGDGESHPIQPQERKLYEGEYKQATDLFQRSLNEYTKSDNMYQREEFKKVMREALQVLNETAAELKRTDLLKQNDKIAQDYNTFQSDDANSPKQLQSDLDKAKKLI